MKVLVIDAKQREVRPHSLAGAEAAVGFFKNGIDMACQLESGDFVYVDAEGMIGPVSHFFTLAGYGQPLATMGLVCGPDAADGLSIEDVRVSADDLLNQIRWISRSEYEAWSNDRGRGAALSAGGVTIQTFSDLAATNRPKAAGSTPLQRG